VVLPVAVLVIAMWVLEIIDVVLGGRLDGLGIQSRSTDGLVGVLLSPLLHGGFGHLMANTVPLVVLGLLVSWRRDGRIWAVVAIVVVVGGLGVWLLGPSGAVTIGASGLVFGLLGYLIVAGAITRHWVDILVSVVVVLVYGSMLWGATPLGVPSGVSWLAHLTGALAGALAALALNRRRSTADRSALASTPG
jgi:hypothetical protein